MVRLLVLSALSLLTACAAHSSSAVILRPAKPLNAPREVVIVGHTDGQIADVLRRYLIQRGFRIKHWAVEGSMAESTGNKVVSGNLASAPYIIELNYLVTESGRRFGCASLDYIRADIVDTARNEVILSTRGAGRTDPCGKTFHVLRDIADAMDTVWGIPFSGRMRKAPPARATNSTSL
jgi:hypothetical protein